MPVARWHGALVAALFSSAVGLYVGNHTVLLIGTIPLAYVVYGSVTGLGPPSLEIERALGDDHVNPGEPVTVTVTVRNDGDRPIPDLRLVDTVPEDVAVVDGAPAAGVALRPDETATVEYDVLPPRGTHEFGSVAVRGRSLAGTLVGTAMLEPSGTTTVTCDTLLDEFPLLDQTMPFPGQHPTDAGGEGIEFHSVREYRRGDPLSHVDWRRLARTGELATVTYREERAAAVVFVIDARSEVTFSLPQGGPSTTDYAVYAAAQGFLTLTDEGHQAGVTTLSPAAERTWVPPGRGANTEAAATDLFDSLQDGADSRGSSAGADGPDSAVAADGGDDDAHETAGGTDLGLDLVQRLPSHAQVVLCTPLADDAPTAVVETLLANHHDVTVLSPNVTGSVTGTAPTPGQAVTDLRRRTRLTDLQRLGVPAVDWQPDTPLQVALAGVIDARNGGWQR
ncbi:DUF58 domain-containing protein [Halorientalis brevis]|nr:DUF58 domain-containing protein [Halorientalis brevis]